MPASSSYIPVARVTLTVTKFEDVERTPAPNRGTGHRMKLEMQNHPRVKQDAEDKPLRVKGGDARLRFTIVSADPDSPPGTIFYPVGIAFRQHGAAGGPLDPVGRGTFWGRRPAFDGRSLTVHDDFREVGDQRRFKFSLVIQRSTDGAIGIIDPGIEHEDP
jgi:hypothetical protein